MKTLLFDRVKINCSSFTASLQGININDDIQNRILSLYTSIFQSSLITYHTMTLSLHIIIHNAALAHEALIEHYELDRYDSHLLLNIMIINWIK